MDPNGAFRRLRERAVQARRSLRQLKNEHKQRLRQYYYDAVRGSSVAAAQRALPGTNAAADAISLGASEAAGSSGGGELEGVGLAALEQRQQQRRAELAAAADAAGEELDAEAVLRTVGPNGLFRVRVGRGSA